MASKIKIMIKTEDNNINLPSIGFGVALTLCASVCGLQNL
jgi:hypothetical protein